MLFWHLRWVVYLNICIPKIKQLWIMLCLILPIINTKHLCQSLSVFKKEVKAGCHFFYNIIIILRGKCFLVKANTHKHELGRSSHWIFVPVGFIMILYTRIVQSFSYTCLSWKDIFMGKSTQCNPINIFRKTDYTLHVAKINHMAASKQDPKVRK